MVLDLFDAKAPAEVRLLLEPSARELLIVRQGDEEIPALSKAVKLGRASITSSRLKRSRLSMMRYDPRSTLPSSTSSRKRPSAPVTHFAPRYALTPRSVRLSSMTSPLAAAQSDAAWRWGRRLSPRSYSGRLNRM